MTVVLEAHQIPKVSRLNRINPFHYGFKLWVRFWWHTKAYSTIFGVMALVLLSLLVLLLQASCNKLSQKFRSQVIKLQLFNSL